MPTKSLNYGKRSVVEHNPYSTTMSGKGLFVLSTLLVLIVIQHEVCQGEANHASNGGAFARTEGTRFVMNGRPFYINDFNAYWMMYMASDPSSRAKVTSAFQQASRYGMKVARTWAFNDGRGTDRPLQPSPGSYNEDTFKGLDFVISEAKKFGVYVILSFVNNFSDFGGRKQYVQWARDRGQPISSDDDFYSNAVIKGYYKDHIKTVLTRINSITRVAYKDDPTIFAWELINEPRCQSDVSGALLQQWVTEMAAHVKSIDSEHLLEIGLEGFYGETTPDKKQYNPGNLEFGSDFIATNLLPQIDFATIHIYADQWYVQNLYLSYNMMMDRLSGESEEAQAGFVDRWVQAHIQDCNTVVKKPLLVAEFGKSYKLPGYVLQKRDAYFGKIYSDIYSSASRGGSCVGGLFWQLMAPNMDTFGDGYEVVLEQSPTTATVIAQQSRKLNGLKASLAINVNFLALDQHVSVLGCGEDLMKLVSMDVDYNISEFELH
ncbi:Glycosyl hydrolase superfamily protein [Prunus dulcis]|uniref:mannan endo-1,4-beta-mannosidase n=1 Tax=Prunus dulcis TaxID=3755 RepID=A0A4Y1RZ52_PRUDU|nr:Glycosyl hydrolase superfamily protein [Prunus dulcis]